MSARFRCQRSYDHRLKELVRTSADPSLAIDLGIPASTVMGWLHESPQQVVALDVLSMKEQELQHEVLMLQRRIRKLLALLRLLVVLLRISGFSLANERVPGGKAKASLLRSIDLARQFLPLLTVVRVLRLPHSAFRGQTPDEMYFGRGDHVPRELEQARNAARKERLDLNRRTHCVVCPQG